MLDVDESERQRAYVSVVHVKPDNPHAPVRQHVCMARRLPCVYAHAGNQFIDLQKGAGHDTSAQLFIFEVLTPRSHYRQFDILVETVATKGALRAFPGNPKQFRIFLGGLPSSRR